MPSYSQAGRSLQITTPLGADQLLLVGFRGQESISRLFRFELDLLAEVGADIPFEDIIGQSVTVQLLLPNEDTRYFSGIVKRFSQGASDDVFTNYRAEVVPKPWLLTKTVQSRIFQNMSVPDILNEVLDGYDFSLGLSETYYPRNYCVQYRESDFDFVSRLMEDEGIYYYFNHSDGAHQMMVTDAPTSYPEVAGQSTLIYEPRQGGAQESMRIRTWEKAQELRANEYTLGEYCFEIPTSNLEQSAPIIDQVQVGTVTHKFNLAGGELEIYDYPAGCAKRYDGVDSSGGTFAAGFTQMSADRSRIVGVRMEEQECTSLEVTGTSDCGNLSAGYLFTLEGHSNGDGDYLLTRVEHNATLSGYRTAEQEAFTYDNRFVCMPTGLVYRPRRVTAKPVIAGFQTATVTGSTSDTSSGQSVFCDQYGRVKVQFHWDRDGDMDGTSSCWLRVAQIWAGNGWGAFFWPRTGHEVVVAFEEGDPDQPLIVGSVYNGANMPPFPLPANSALGGVRSASVSGSANQNFNGIVFNDTLGTEHLAIHSENNMSLNSEGDKQFHGTNKGERVAGTCFFTVGSIQGMAPGGGTGGGSGGGSGGGPTVPVASLLPSTLSFGNQNVGTTSAPFTVTLTNTASPSLTVASVVLSGTNSGDFAQTNTYGSPLSILGNCTISVTFTPGATGSRSATLTVTDGANNVYSVSLSGTGLAGSVFVLSPSSLSFGNQDVGDSASQTVSLSNTGSASLSSSNLSFALSGSNAGDYSQSNNCGTLLPGSSCTITVTFTPSANGSSTATLTATYTSGGSAVSTQTVELTGTGLSTGPFTQGNTLDYNPPSQAYSGQLCEVIYGTYAESIIGAYNEIVIGSNNVLVVDPLSLISFFPNAAPAAAVLGAVMSATGGNSTFTIGDNVTFSMGQQMSMTITPEVQGGATLSFTACVSQVAVIDVLAGLLSSLAIIWAVLYAGYQQPQSGPTSADDGPIITLLSVCQGVQGALQMAIQIAAGVYQAGQEVFVEDANGQVAALPAPEAESIAADADSAKAAKAASDADKVSSDADKGVTDADQGVKDADSGVTKADQGVKDADSGVTKADQGVKDADSGVTKADQGVKDADSGVSKADQGVKDADSGVTKADQGVKDADEGVTKADQGVKDADEGVTKADKGVKDADEKFKASGSEEDKAKLDKAKTAKSDADDAKVKADKTKQDADAEKVKADKTKQDADAEKVKADKTKQDADAEKVKADKAKQDADAEKVKADKAKQDADAEKVKADKAKQDADAEKVKADKAKKDADAEKVKADKAKKVAHEKADAAKKKADYFKKSWESKKTISSFKTKVANKLKMKVPAKV